MEMKNPVILSAAERSGAKSKDLLRNLNCVLEDSSTSPAAPLRMTSPYIVRQRASNARPYKWVQIFGGGS